MVILSEGWESHGTTNNDGELLNRQPHDNTLLNARDLGELVKKVQRSLVILRSILRSSDVNDNVIEIGPVWPFSGGNVNKIWVDIGNFGTKVLVSIEVFTSVPPDPVATLHCRYWVFFL